MGTHELPFQKGHSHPIFGPCRVGLKSDGTTDDGTLSAARGYANPYGPSQSDGTVDGDVALLRKFLSTVDLVNENISVCCGQTARWTMMPLGIKVSLGPGDTVLDLTDNHYQPSSPTLPASPA